MEIAARSLLMVIITSTRKTRTNIMEDYMWLMLLSLMTLMKTISGIRTPKDPQMALQAKALVVVAEATSTKRNTLMIIATTTIMVPALQEQEVSSNKISHLRLGALEAGKG